MDPTALSAVLRFAPQTYRSHSHSPSCSPSRRQHFASRELDPLLSNLSPTSTLEALQATHAVGTSDRAEQSLLQDSIATVSTSERALGIRAALAAKELRLWHAEIVSWPWPNSSIDQRNGFLVPPAEPGSSALPMEGQRMDEGEYWGSLPAATVLQYEERIESIRDDLEHLEVEELKDYVRDAHLQPRSRPSSRYGPGDSILQSNYARLDDFTAIITATIMYALPYITRLNALLDVWSVRLAVLRQVPGFLRHLEEVRIFMGKLWQASETCAATKEDHVATPLSRAAFDTMRSVQQSHVYRLGKELDSMLDALEGREDTVPDEWIDSMENIEAEFGSWVIDTENQVLENEWKIKRSLSEVQVEQIECDGSARLDGTSRFSSALSERAIPFPHFDTNNSSEIKLAMVSQLSNSQNHVEHRNGIHTESNNSKTNTGSTEKLTGQITGLERPKHDVSAAPIVSSLHHELAQNAIGSGSTDTSKGPDEAINFDGVEPSAEILSSELLTVPLLSKDQDLENNRSDGQTIFPLDFATQPELLKFVQTQQSPLVKQSFSHRPTPLVLKKKRSRTGVESNGSPDTSYPSSATTAYYSDMSSPEIYSASFAEYVGSPVEVISPRWHEKGSPAPIVALSRQPSHLTEKGTQVNSDIDDSSKVLTYQRSRPSSSTPGTTIQESSEAVEDDLASDPDDLIGSGLKRASMTSIEILPRSEVCGFPGKVKRLA